MSESIYKKISKEEGFSIDELKNGYAIFLTDFGVKVIQKIDCLDFYGLQKFKTDTDAGLQAMMDGVNLFVSNHEELQGWFILDTEENRRAVLRLQEESC